MSCKHLNEQTQFRFIVKKLFVATYGIVSTSVVSGFGASTLNVAQHPSTFSTLNTFEHVTPAVPQTTSSLVVGIDHGVPFPQQVYNTTGLVLQPNVDTEHPKKPRSQVSKHASLHSALSCNMLITVRISEMHLHSFELLLLLHI